MTDPRVASPVLSLDGPWHFVRDPEARLARPTGLPEGEAIEVPGCWEAQAPDPFGIVHAWIWRDVTVPADWPEEGDLIARFGAVMYRCETWLDDRLVGRHEGGYTPFDVPLTGARRGRSSRAVPIAASPSCRFERSRTANRPGTPATAGSGARFRSSIDHRGSSVDCAPARTGRPAAFA